MRRAAKVDANQSEIVEALRMAGVSVIHLHQLGHGIPDILASIPGLTIVGSVSRHLIELLESIDGLVVHRGANLLIEIKMPGKDLTDDQIEFFKKHRGQCAIVFGPEEALDLIGR